MFDDDRDCEPATLSREGVNTYMTCQVCGMKSLISLGWDTVTAMFHRQPINGGKPAASGYYLAVHCRNQSCLRKRPYTVFFGLDELGRWLSAKPRGC